jgi:hypothetical protein
VRIVETSPKKYEGPMAPVVGSILFVVGWLVFILLFALYWSKSFDLFQNIIVTIATLAIDGLLIGAVWLIWYRPTGELRSKHNERIPA